MTFPSEGRVEDESRDRDTSYSEGESKLYITYVSSPARTYEELYEFIHLRQLDLRSPGARKGLKPLIDSGILLEVLLSPLENR